MCSLVLFVADASPLDAFSWGVLLSLIVALAASAVTFWLLVRRETSHRQWVSMSEWARGAGFRISRSSGGEPPPPFDALHENQRPQVRLSFTRERTTILQLEAPGGEAPPTRTLFLFPDDDGPAVRDLRTRAQRRPAWNVLVRQIESDWPPTALRPANDAASLVDLFPLSSYPTLVSSERFVVYGADSVTAATLGDSSLPALLPADVALLLHGKHLVLDFSDRPFDPLEFGRMLALAEQLVAHLPAAGRPSGAARR